MVKPESKVIHSAGGRFRYDPISKSFQEWDDEALCWKTHTPIPPELKKKLPRPKPNPIKRYDEWLQVF